MMKQGVLMMVRQLFIPTWDVGLERWLHNIGVGDTWAQAFTSLIWFVALFVLGVFLFLIAQRITGRILKRATDRLGEILVAKRFVRRMCYFIPLAIISGNYENVWEPFPRVVAVLDKIIGFLYIYLFVIVINAFLYTLVELYQRPGAATRSKPVKTFIQFAQIIIYIIAVIVSVSLLTGKSPSTLIVGLGAMSAVLMLVFKDSLLGLVAGFQLSANNMVQVGDWIEMPKYNADGEVIDITLTTVKLQNWDKTISTIPTYNLISDSVKNWRGMQEAGGRRIARAINIDMRSVRFCSDKLIEELKKLALVAEYVTKVQHAIDEENKRYGFDMSIPGNGSRQTNLGIFRAYMTAYLKQMPELNQSMPLMVRQLAPTENGIPLQLYCFTRDTSWEPYEKVQSDIFEHLIGVLPIFELSVFQNLGGGDIARQLAQKG